MLSEGKNNASPKKNTEGFLVLRVPRVSGREGGGRSERTEEEGTEGESRDDCSDVDCVERREVIGGGCCEGGPKIGADGMFYLFGTLFQTTLLRLIRDGLQRRPNWRHKSNLRWFGNWGPKGTRSAATKLVIIFAMNGGTTPVNDSAIITSFVADGETVFLWNLRIVPYS